MTGRRSRRRVKPVSQVKKDVVPPKPPTVGDEVIEESEREQRYARFVSELEAIELANERNPHDVEILKKWAETLVCLGYYQLDKNQAMFYLQEAKLKLEEALRIKEDYYEVMYELGMFHFSMLLFDQSLELRGEGFMGHCREAIALFEQVKDKAPDVYKEDMLYRVRNQMPLNLEVPDFLEHLITKSSDLYEDDDDEMDEGVGTISTYKLYMIFEAVDMLFAKLGLDPDDTVLRNGLVKALGRLPIRGV